MAEADSSREENGVLSAGILRIVNDVRRLPSDLVAVVAVVLLTNLVTLMPVVRETPLSIPFGLVFLLFVPGYALIAALFPEAGKRSTGSDSVDATADEIEHLSAETGASSGIDGLERIALSFGLSIAISSLLGLGMNFTPWGIRPVPVLVAISAFTLLSVVVAIRRRLALPATERFRARYNELLADARDGLLQPASRGELFVNILLTMGVVIAVSSVGWAMVAPQEGESFTEFYLLNEAEGEALVAEDYPTEYSIGEQRKLVVGISNQEHQRVEYQVLVRLQEVRFANNSTTVLRSERLSTFQRTLSHNETWHQRHTVTPTFTGTQLRLQYLLYREDVPSEPSATSAYRETHLWINVTSDG